MLLWAGDLDTLAGVEITADDFYRPAHGHTFSAITELVGRGDRAGPVSVAGQLRDVAPAEISRTGGWIDPPGCERA